MSFTRYQSLEDRVVLISGGASGIGEAFVRAFADNGARVAFLDLQEEAGQALAKSLAGSARHAPLFLRCDVTRTDELKAAIAEARRKLGPASALINNAANDQRQTFTDVTPEEFDRTMAVNFRHVYFASPGRRAADGRAGRRIDRQHVVDHLAGRRARVDGLRLGQGRRGRLHPFAGAPGRHAPHPRQCHRPGAGADGEAAKAVVSDGGKGRRGGEEPVPARHHHAGRHRPSWRCSSPPTTAA